LSRASGCWSTTSNRGIEGGSGEVRRTRENKEGNMEIRKSVSGSKKEETSECGDYSAN
jgi:hypothetical protein